MDYVERLWSSYKKTLDPDVKKNIVLNYMGVVHHVLKRIGLPSTVLFDNRDYLHFGVEGLSQAIDRFDPDYGTKFETYAMQRIRGKIFDEIRKNSFNKRITFDPNATTFFSTASVSINTDYGMQLCEMLPIDQPSPADLLEKKELIDALLKSIDEFNEREKKIYVSYFFEGKKYKEIGEILDLKESSICLILQKMKKKLKEKLACHYAN